MTNEPIAPADPEHIDPVEPATSPDDPAQDPEKPHGDPLIDPDHGVPA